MMIAMVAISIVSFFGLIAATFAGMSSADFGAGLWPVVVVMPLFALPVAVALLIALVIVSARRRARDAAARPTSGGRTPGKPRSSQSK